ncbi:hypothetical protein CFC21_075194 [Triticum aestivum]|uniref:Acyl carrier protein n=3 Tax=Triticum TaxID=4564 RepID=A0A9R1AUF4_TRITD|nr:acyl carrier protein 3, chloroplastic-like [Triticum dicoccoides]XP_044391861.1 acyl carrier protein 3, chloroplastic-like [Triticum aestivum]KAF7069579.1 hypothetical protein CFC21_075194 [Triticum aestivum]VAI40644.1 unnamed protein product [Triticum turgidum subsp. durum]
MSALFAAAGSAVLPAHRLQVSSSSGSRRSAAVTACFSRQQSFPSISIRSAPAKRFLHLACSAKQDTIDKVCGIVKKQLAVAEDTVVSGETKFADLGADSLDTVEIVMGLEEAFSITVDESSAQEIRTVEDAASLIDKLVTDKDS